MKGKLAAAVAAISALSVALGALKLYEKPKPFGASYFDAPTKVLIVGGGFGGLAVLKELARALDGDREVGVALLDSSNYTTFWPMVPATISGDIQVRHTAHALRRVTQPLGAEFYQAEVTRVDFEARQVLERRRILFPTIIWCWLRVAERPFSERRGLRSTPWTSKDSGTLCGCATR